MTSFPERILGAAMLDVNTYEEVEADKGALGQAIAVVVLSSISAGLAGILEAGAIGMAVGLVVGLVAWFLWIVVVYVIGVKLIPEPQTKSDIPELVRTVGFASSPGLLLFLGIIPVLGVLISMIINVWMLVAMVIAVRQALDYESTGRAIGVCVLGWLFYIGIFMIGAVMVMAPFIAARATG